MFSANINNSKYPSFDYSQNGNTFCGWLLYYMGCGLKPCDDCYYSSDDE